VICAVYTVTHIDTGRHYVGFTSREVSRRWAEHTRRARRPRTHFQRALNKYGAEAFRFEVVATFETPEEAQLAEQALIQQTLPVFNETLGGEGRAGYVCRPETRAKISAARAGKPGHKTSDETRAKLSAAQKGNTKMLGKTRSPETRAKISAAMRGNTNRRKHQP
jgi:group I intron endonuclease